MRNVSDRRCRENQNTFMFSNVFPKCEFYRAFLLPLYGVPRMSGDVSVGAGFLCDKTTGLVAAIKETPCKTTLSVCVCCKIKAGMPVGNVMNCL
jgi:hypothetical protein